MLASQGMATSSSTMPVHGVQHVGDVEEHVHVQQVLAPGSGVESWTALGEHGSPTGPLTTWPPGRRGGWKSFLHQVGTPREQGQAAPAPSDRPEGTKRQPRVLTVAEMQAILVGCVRLRDRFP